MIACISYLIIHWFHGMLCCTLAEFWLC